MYYYLHSADEWRAEKLGKGHIALVCPAPFQAAYKTCSDMSVSLWESTHTTRARWRCLPQATFLLILSQEEHLDPDSLRAQPSGPRWHRQGQNATLPTCNHAPGPTPLYHTSPTQGPWHMLPHTCVLASSPFPFLGLPYSLCVCVSSA